MQPGHVDGSAADPGRGVLLPGLCPPCLLRAEREAGALRTGVPHTGAAVRALPITLFAAVSVARNKRDRSGRWSFSDLSFSTLQGARPGLKSKIQRLDFLWHRFALPCQNLPPLRLNIRFFLSQTTLAIPNHTKSKRSNNYVQQEQQSYQRSGSTRCHG